MVLTAVKHSNSNQPPTVPANGDCTITTARLAGSKHRPGCPSRSKMRGFASKLGRFVLVFAVLGIVASTGCNRMIWRSQSPDSLLDSKKKPSETKYVGDACSIWGLGFAKIEGIGLVTGLDGTGSNPEPSGQRDHLLADLRADESISKPTAALSSKNTSMVLLRGLIPPGARKGDRFDVEIATLPSSQTTSLKYGRLHNASMRPMMPTGRTVKLGNVNALAAGSVLVDAVFETRQDEANQRHGWVLGGGKVLEDRKLGLSVRLEDTKVKLTRSIAWSINQRFSAVENGVREGVAHPKTDRIVEIVVPDAYRHNIGRYFQVLTRISYDESPQARVERIERLAREIMDPKTSMMASLELEGIGEQATDILRRTLKHPQPAIRFFAAQSLAYMQVPDGIDVLRKTAEESPQFRWHALRALASSGDQRAVDALVQLFDVSSAETRYGAFDSIRMSNPAEPLIEGRWLADDFFFHVLATNADPMVHVSRSKRPEIVLFGREQTIADDFIYIESGLTIKGIGNGRIQITRYLPQTGEIRKTCSHELAQLIPLMADMGCDYTTTVSVLRRAKQDGALPSRFVVNAIPAIGKLDAASYHSDEPAEGTYTADVSSAPSDAELDLSEISDVIPASGGSEVERTDSPGESAAGMTETAKNSGKSGKSSLFTWVKGWFDR